LGLTPGKTPLALEWHAVTLLHSSHNLEALFLNPFLAQERKALAPSFLQQHFNEKGFIQFLSVVNQFLHYSMGAGF